MQSAIIWAGVCVSAYLMIRRVYKNRERRSQLETEKFHLTPNEFAWKNRISAYYDKMSQDK